MIPALALREMEKVDLFDACAVVVLNASVSRPVPITGVLL